MHWVFMIPLRWSVIWKPPTVVKIRRSSKFTFTKERLFATSSKLQLISWRTSAEPVLVFWKLWKPLTLFFPATTATELRSWRTRRKVRIKFLYKSLIVFHSLGFERYWYWGIGYWPILASIGWYWYWPNTFLSNRAQY